MGIVIQIYSGKVPIRSGVEIGLFWARIVVLEIVSGPIAMVARFFGPISGLVG
jgi:hypothetical protein